MWKITFLYSWFETVEIDNLFVSVDLIDLNDHVLLSRTWCSPMPGWRPLSNVFACWFSTLFQLLKSLLFLSFSWELSNLLRELSRSQSNVWRLILYKVLLQLQFLLKWFVNTIHSINHYTTKLRMTNELKPNFQFLLIEGVSSENRVNLS